MRHQLSFLCGRQSSSSTSLSSWVKMRMTAIKTNETNQEDEDVANGEGNKEKEEEVDPTILLIPIGYPRTVFCLCDGTPHQELLAPHVRGQIELDPSLLGPDSDDGLNGYSHVWLVFVFHLNMNKAAVASAI